MGLVRVRFCKASILCFNFERNHIRHKKCLYPKFLLKQDILTIGELNRELNRPVDQNINSLNITMQTIYDCLAITIFSKADKAKTKCAIKKIFCGKLIGDKNTIHCTIYYIIIKIQRSPLNWITDNKIRL